MDITCVTVDCRDPGLVADFWNEALHWGGVAAAPDGSGAVCGPAGGGRLPRVHPRARGQAREEPGPPGLLGRSGRTSTARSSACSGWAPRSRGRRTSHPRSPAPTATSCCATPKATSSASAPGPFRSDHGVRRPATGVIGDQHGLTALPGADGVTGPLDRGAEDRVERRGAGQAEVDVGQVEGARRAASSPWSTSTHLGVADAPVDDGAQVA